MGELLLRDDLRNPSSIHGGGRAAREIVEAARRHVADSVGAKPLEVTFTSGGTEADALAILGTARGLRRFGRPDGVLSSVLEHPAVTASLDVLERERHRVVRLPVDAFGRIDGDALREAVAAHPEIGLVSLAAANHELGNLYDIAALAEAVRSVRSDVLIHTDAVQAFGKVPVGLEHWNVDLMSVSSHKVQGPSGAGALVHRQRVPLLPVLVGGGQERGLRGGTESLLCIHGFGIAAQLARCEQASRRAHCEVLRARLLHGLRKLDARIHGDPDQHTGNTINAAFPGCDGHLLVMALDLEGFCVSTGSACSAGTTEPSPVVQALGFDKSLAAEAVRFSLGASNTEAEVDALLAILPELVARVRAAGSRGGLS